MWAIQFTNFMFYVLQCACHVQMLRDLNSSESFQRCGQCYQMKSFKETLIFISQSPCVGSFCANKEAVVTICFLRSVD